MTIILHNFLSPNRNNNNDMPDLLPVLFPMTLSQLKTHVLLFMAAVMFALREAAGEQLVLVMLISSCKVMERHVKVSLRSFFHLISLELK